MAMLNNQRVVHSPAKKTDFLDKIHHSLAPLLSMEPPSCMASPADQWLVKQHIWNSSSRMMMVKPWDNYVFFVESIHENNSGDNHETSIVLIIDS